MLIKNSFIFALTTLAKGVFTFAVIAAYTRLLSPVEYGEYIIILSVILFVDAFAFQSVRHCLIRHITSDVREGDLAYMGNAMVLYAGLGALAIILPLLGVALGLIESDESVIIYALLGVLILAEAVSNLIIDVSRIRNHYAVFVIVNIAKPLLSLALGTFLILQGWGVQGAIYGILGGTVLCGIYGAVKSRDISFWPFKYYDPKIIAALFAFGAPLALTFFIQSGMALSSRFLLEGLADTELVGLFSAAQDVPNKLLNLVILGVHIAAYPLAVKAMEDGGEAACREQLKSNFLLLIGIALPSVVGMVMLKAPLANIFVGEAFRPFMLEYFTAFAALAFVNAIIQYYLLLAFNLSKQNQKLIVPFAVSFFLMVGIGFLAIPEYKAAGAIFAAFVAYGFLFIATLWRGRAVFALPLPVLETSKIVAATACMAVAVFFMGKIGFTSESILGFIASIAVGGGVYAGAIVALNVSGIRGHLRALVGKRV